MTLFLPKGQRVRRIRTKVRKDARHLEYVASQPCCCCGRRPVVVHHLLHQIPEKIGRRDDKYAIPLCPDEHNNARGVHGPDGEIPYLRKHGVNGKELAERLWSESHV